MTNPSKTLFLNELVRRYGSYKSLSKSKSLFTLDNGDTRLYFRYSKKHPNNRTFFGLRKIDLQVLSGHQSIICFFWDGQKDPLFIPFEQFEEIFFSHSPASDGQYKVQVYEHIEATELYIANAGRFNVESFFGWDFLESLIKPTDTPVIELSHYQIQTLLGGIGTAKGLDIWIPSNNRGNLDWKITPPFNPVMSIPPSLMSIQNIVEEIDVIWLERGKSCPVALFEVEHSTPIYSGLLRLNDVHLVLPRLSTQFGIVSNDSRRALFVRQIERPTFKTSGLSDLCTFFEYQNVLGWHNRIHKRKQYHENEQQR